MSAGGKASAGLGVAAGAVQAVPGFGQIAGGILGLGSALAGLFGKKKKEPPPPFDPRTLPAVEGQGGQQVATGLNPVAQIPPSEAVSAASMPQTAAVSQTLAQIPQLSPLQNQQANFLRKLVLKNDETFNGI